MTFQDRAAAFSAAHEQSMQMDFYFHVAFSAVILCLAVIVMMHVRAQKRKEEAMKEEAKLNDADVASSAPQYASPVVVPPQTSEAAMPLPEAIAQPGSSRAPAIPARAATAEDHKPTAAELDAMEIDFSADPYSY